MLEGQRDGVCAGRRAELAHSVPHVGAHRLYAEEALSYASSTTFPSLPPVVNRS